MICCEFFVSHRVILFANQISRRCMFSKGNVSEKARFASLIQPGETVVDLFAGIGYFTVSALVLSANAKVIHACEWNPNAVEALRKNLKLNRVQHRCVVHPGDCRSIRLLDEGADRVSLGLLPSSRVGWETGVKCLSNAGGWLHIHENTPEDATATLAHQVETEITALLKRLRGDNWVARCTHVQRVKSYAPRIIHVVLDVECRPQGVYWTNVVTRQIPPQFQDMDEDDGKWFQLRHSIRHLADEVMCSAGKELSVQQTTLLASDAELLFRRTARRLKTDFSF